MLPRTRCDLVLVERTPPRLTRWTREV